MVVRDVLVAAIFAGLTMAQVAPEMPQTCFDDSTCYPLYKYTATPSQRAEFVELCKNQTIQTIMPYATALQMIEPLFPKSTLKSRGPDIATVAIYTFGSFMRGINSALRSGKPVPSEYKPLILLTASGLTALRNNHTMQKYTRDGFFFRAEGDFPGAVCTASDANRVDPNMTTHIIKGFDSFTLSLKYAAKWPGVKRVLFLYRDSKPEAGGGTYITPVGSGLQYEVTFPSGTRVQELACEQVQVTGALGHAKKVAMSFLYDVTTSTPLDTAQAAVLLKKMKRELQRQQRMCWPYQCYCEGASPSQDLNWPVPDSRCKRESDTDLAEDIDDTHAGAENVARSTLVAFCFFVGLVALGVLVFILRRRSQRRGFQEMI